MFRKSVRERSWQRGKGTQQLTLGGWGKRVDEHTADLGPDVRTPPRHPHKEQPEEREVSDAHSAQGTEIKGFKFAKEELLIGFRADAGLVTSLSVSPCGVKLFSQKSPSLIISKKGWEHIQSQRKYYFSQNTHTCTHACTHTDEMRERKPIFLVGCIRTGRWSPHSSFRTERGRMWRTWTHHLPLRYASSTVCQMHRRREVLFLVLHHFVYLRSIFYAILKTIIIKLEYSPFKTDILREGRQIKNDWLWHLKLIQKQKIGPKY